MEKEVFDMLVIGAGATGLMAAREMAMTGKSVAVIEARNRIGGRIHTISDPGFELPVEMGAEFIHGKLEPTLSLLRKASALPYNVTSDIWKNNDGHIEELNDFIEDPQLLNRQFKKLEHDVSVSHFIENYLQGDQFEDLRFTLKNYVEGYYAADTLKSSTYSLRDDLQGSHEKQYRAEGGYGKLADYLYEDGLKHGVKFFLSLPAVEVEWRRNHVVVKTHQRIFEGSQILITVPVGVLQSEKIRFHPALPDKMIAARSLGYGPVIKIILQFDEPFWKNKNITQGKDLSKMSFIFSSAKIPTWWTYYPKDVAMLTGWSGGPHAEEIRSLDDTAILNLAVTSVAGIFGLSNSEVQRKLRASKVANWVQDPFSCGAYSYEVVHGAEFKKVLSMPEEDTIYFAGEGLVNGTEIGTVNAALVSGRETARAMIAAFKKQT